MPHRLAQLRDMRARCVASIVETEKDLTGARPLLFAVRAFMLFDLVMVFVIVAFWRTMPCSWRWLAGVFVICYAVSFLKPLFTVERRVTDAVRALAELYANLAKIDQMIDDIQRKEHE